MDLTAPLTVLLLSLTPFHKDAKHENPEERAERMSIIARAIDDAADRATCAGEYATEGCAKIWPHSKKHLATMLVTLGYWESRFALHVQQGKCGPTECDAVKLRDGTIYHRARSYWQIQATGLVARNDWSGMIGTDLIPTARASWTAAKVVSAAARRCAKRAPSWEMGAISGYAGGIGCTWRKAGPRVRFKHMLDGKLAKLLEPAA